MARVITKSLVISLLAIFVIAALCLARANIFMQRVLANHVPIEVRIDDMPYEVRREGVISGGRAVQGIRAFRARSLAYTKVTATESPDLGFAGANLDEFRDSVDALEQLQNTLADTQADAEKADRVRTSLYPIRFLRSAIELEAARRTFVLSGANVDAHSYEQALRRSIDAYRSDLERFRTAFIASVPEQSPTYGTLTRTMSREGMLRGIDRIEEYARELLTTSIRRRACAAGVGLVCRANAPTSLVPRVNSVRNDTPTAILELYRDAGLKIMMGPTTALSSSTCVPTDRKRVYTSIRYGTDPKTLRSVPFYAGDIILIRSAAYASFPFYEDFVRNGITYVLTDPLTHYECPEAVHDISAVVAVSNVVRFAKEHDLPDMVRPDERSRIAALREGLLGSSVDESGATLYLRELRAAMDSSETARTLQREVDDLILSLRDKSAGVPAFIFSMVVFENGNRALLEKGFAIDTDARNLFFIRSGFASLFLSHNARTGDSDTIFAVNELPSDEQPYVYFSDFPKSASTTREVTDSIRFFWYVHLPQ